MCRLSNSHLHQLPTVGEVTENACYVSSKGNTITLAPLSFFPFGFSSKYFGGFKKYIVWQIWNFHFLTPVWIYSAVMSYVTNSLLRLFSDLEKPCNIFWIGIYLSYKSSIVYITPQIIGHVLIYCIISLWFRWLKILLILLYACHYMF